MLNNFVAVRTIALMSLCSCCRAEILFHDDFDSDVAGSYPSDWTVRFNSSGQLVTDTVSYDGENSFSLTGTPYAARESYYSFSAPETEWQLSYSFYLDGNSDAPDWGDLYLTYHSNDYTVGCGFNRENGSTGPYQLFCLTGDQVQTQDITITPDQWYTVEATVDPINDEVSYSLNDQLVLENVAIGKPDSKSDRLTVHVGGHSPPATASGSLTGYFDDIEVSDVEAPPSPKVYALLVGSRAPAFSLGGLIEWEDKVRGDLDVANVQSQLDWAITESIVVNYDDTVNIADLVEAALDEIALVINPGDTLIFYYSGHGGGSSDIGVDEIIYAADPELSNVGLTDTRLASFLSAPEYAFVRKAVFLDSCRAGGFWTEDGWDGDSDLEDLLLTALFAAAGEDENALSNLIDGTGIWTNQILPWLTPDTTYETLQGLISNSYLNLDAEGYFKSLDGGSGALDATPFVYFSPDFDLSYTFSGTYIPEPTSALLLLLQGAAFVVQRRLGTRVVASHGL